MLNGFGIKEKVSRLADTLTNGCTYQATKLHAVTANNTTNNDMMVNCLAELVDGFPRELNCGRCFNHIINLCAKSVLRAFEASKKDFAAALNDAELTLQGLLVGLDLDEGLDLAASDADKGDDNTDG